MGTLQVGGTTLATKNVSTGKVDLSTNADGGLITMFDQFYLENDFNNNASTITPWTRVTASTHPATSPLGTGLTQSSGVFSFPETGLYLITGYFQALENTGGADNIAVELYVTVDNSNYYIYYRGFTEVDATTVTGYFTIGPALINCTNTTNVKFKFVANSLTGDNSIRGNNGNTSGGGVDQIYTNFTAMRIGVSQ